MKIIVVVPQLTLGGAERVASLLTQEWSRSNKVFLVVFDSKKPAFNFGGELIDLNIPASNSIIKKIFNILHRILKLSATIKIIKPDIVISILENANVVSTIASLIFFFILFFLM